MSRAHQIKSDPYPLELRARAVAAMVAGLSIREAANRFGVSRGATQRWLALYKASGGKMPDTLPHRPKPKPQRIHVASLPSRDGVDGDAAPAQPAFRHRTIEDLTDLVYDALIAELEAIVARAVATSKPEWLEKQTADGLARLAEAQWTQAARFINSLRPADEPSESHPGLPEGESGEGESAADLVGAAAGVRGDGAVDSAS